MSQRRSRQMLEKTQSIVVIVGGWRALSSAYYYYTFYFTSAIKNKSYKRIFKEVRIYRLCTEKVCSRRKYTQLQETSKAKGDVVEICRQGKSRSRRGQELVRAKRMSSRPLEKTVVAAPRQPWNPSMEAYIKRKAFSTLPPSNS